MSMEKMAEVTIESIAKEGYKDIIHPSAESIGAIISLPFRSARIAFRPIENWIINKEESLGIVAKAVDEKMAKIPPEKQCEPEAHIAIPLINQICICQDSNELRDIYANLLVASMNKDTKNYVLPAFTSVIGQLTPDEARILKYLGEKMSIPTLEIRAYDKNNENEYGIIAKNYINIDEIKVDIIDNCEVYIDNLSRLKIVDCNFSVQLANNKLYEELIDNANKREWEIEKRKIQYFRGIISLTNFGQMFYNICLSDDNMQVKE